MSLNLAVIGFGSNKGNRFNYIKQAVKHLALNRKLDLLKISSVYETEPWGYLNQDKFLNCAAVFWCRASHLELHKITKQTESALGRIKRDKWKEREIDIDILFLGNKIINSKKLVIPHKFITQRNFVMVPLVEILPGYVHPVLKRKLSQLGSACKDKGKVTRYHIQF